MSRLRSLPVFVVGRDALDRRPLSIARPMRQTLVKHQQRHVPVVVDCFERRQDRTSQRVVVHPRLPAPVQQSVSWIRLGKCSPAGDRAVKTRMVRGLVVVVVLEW